MRVVTDGVSVGVVGVGSMGSRHACNLHSRVVGARLGGVADADPARAQAVAAGCGSAPIFEDAHALIQDDGIDAVVIASPNATHAELTLECLRHDKPVLCEKPLATSAADARKIVEAEVELGEKLVHVGFMRRYDPQHLGVKEVAESGDIGRPVLLKGWHRNPTMPANPSSELVVVGSAIHDLDAARWVLGQEIEEVYARGIRTGPVSGTLDLQLILLSLSGGCLATIEVYSTAAYGYEVGVELVGERGTARTAQLAETVVRRSRTLSRRVEESWLERFEAAYVAELEQWIGNIGAKHLAGPGAWDGYVSLLAAESCISSLRSGSPHRPPALERPALYR